MTRRPHSRIRCTRVVGAVAAATLVVPLGWAATAPGQAAAPKACTPDAAPTYAGDTPTGKQVLGFDLGAREASANQMVRYLRAVDAARDDVSTGTFARSEQGRALTYAIVGDPVDVEIAQDASARLRDPSTSPSEAAQIAATAPAIVWMAGNVHGNEESGGDAALEMLYELADRTDCAATKVRDHTVTVIIPTQNPDGRELDTRRNSYGFDLNRDWFARTQAETDGKLDLLMQYPPVLLSDNHEMGGTDFFFPPNADPVHHEIADRSIDWINDLYGPAMAAEFDRNGWDFFNDDIYDLLYMGYGDSVPTTALLGAGMTYEKGGDSPIAERTREQFAATFASMYALADRKASVLRGLAGSYREARAEGAAGTLEPNEVFEAGNEVQLQVPDETVRSYFIPDTPGKRPETRALVRRLQGMDVVVHRLTAPLTVPDYRDYGAKAGVERTLAAGTYYVPMAQAQKHWVQVMLGEDSYVPFPYFYDVTAWSGPLLFNVPGGRSGAAISPSSRVVAPVAAPTPPTVPGDAPSIGLWLTDDGTTAYESEGWTRWLLEKKWQVPYRKLDTAAVREGALAPLDVLLVPSGDAETAFDDLGARGRSALRAWLADGGRLVGWQGGTELTARLGLTTARLTAPTSDVPGSLIRVQTPPGPLTRGVGPQAWNFYEYDALLRTARGSAAVSYPSDSSFFVSGYQRGARELKGTAAVVAEKYAAGRVVLFAGDPNFRAFTDGTQKILWNAIFGADPAPAAPDAAAAPTATRRAAADAATYESLTGRAVVTVRAAGREDALTALRGAGLGATATDLGGGLVRLSWPAPDEDGRADLSALLESLRGVPGGVVTASVSR